MRCVSWKITLTRNDIAPLRRTLKRNISIERHSRSFIEAMAEKLMEVDPTIPPLPLKDVVYSDRNRAHSRYSGYIVISASVMIKRYIKITSQPHGLGPDEKVLTPRTISIFNLAINHSSRIYTIFYMIMARAGKWHPDAGHLARIRHCIHRRPDKFKRPLLKPAFKKAFGGIDALLTTEDRLRTAPKVYLQQ